MNNNKYQEALTNLEGIQMSDEYSLCDIDEMDTFDYDMNPKRFSPIEAFECLGEIVDKEEKYNWHDLRKNPNDLPEKDGTYLVCTETLVQFEYKFKFFKNYYVRKYYSDVNKFEGIAINADVIAWKYIEEFE